MPWFAYTLPTPYRYTPPPPPPPPGITSRSLGPTIDGEAVVGSDIEDWLSSSPVLERAFLRLGLPPGARSSLTAVNSNETNKGG